MGLNTTIDLTSEQHDTVLELLHEHLPNTTAWAYGSRVKWTSRPNSDLDMVVFSTPEQSRQVAELQTAFEESSLPFRVDLFVWDTVADIFRERIKSSYMVLTQTCQTTTLGEVVDLKISSVDKKTMSDEIPVKLCNYTDVYKNNFIRPDIQFMDATATVVEIDKFSLQQGDVVITKDSEKYDDIGVPAYIREDIDDLVCGYHLAILRPDAQKIYGPYLYYALETSEAQDQFHSYANGVTRFGLRKVDIGRVEIPYPQITRQYEIGDTLVALDDKINLNRRMSQTLEEIPRALFKSWFVDFDPVQTKMEDRWLSEESLLGLPTECYSLFPCDLTDSELGQIPNGWVVKELGELIELNYGRPLKAKDRLGGTIPVYGSNGILGSHDVKLADGPGIVIGRKGNPGTVQWAHDNFFAIDTTFYVSLMTRELSMYFLRYALEHQNFLTISADSAVPGLNRNLAYKNRQIVPGKQTVELFDSVVIPILEKVYELDEECILLDATRRILLPNLIFGDMSITTIK